MGDFLWTAVQVIVGAFLLFAVTRVRMTPMLIQGQGWLWVALVAVLTLAMMLVHRFAFGSSINSPFFTAVLFAVSLNGILPNDAPAELRQWIKRGVGGVIAGCLVGWLSFATIVSIA